MAGEVYDNGYVTVSAGKEQNFQVLVSDWFNTFVAGTTASTTEASRRNLLKNHIIKAFGELDIQNVDTARLQRFFNDKVKTGLAADTTGKIKNLLNNFFIYAVKKHFVKTNPMSEVVIKKRVSVGDAEDKNKALRQEIRQQVFAFIDENPILKPIVITFAFTGLRPQELIALKWETVNLDEKTLSVKKAVNRTATFDDEGNVVSRGVTVGKTKTPKSVRTIVMPDIVADVLKAWLSYCKENGISSPFVFPSTKTGEMRSYSGLRSMLERFIKRHKLQDEGITLYTFRHTFATMLLEARENPKIVASLMGHKKVSTTLDIYL
jgi:ATP-dependent helicase/nuclease subunit A